MKKSESMAMETPSTTPAPAATLQPEGASLFSSIEDAARRYRGTIDSVLISTDTMVSVRLTLPAGKLHSFQKRLSRSCSVAVTDTVSESDEGLISVLIEVHDKGIR